MSDKTIYVDLWGDMQEAARNEIAAFHEAHPNSGRAIADMEVIVANFCQDPAPRDDHECTLREKLLSNIRKNIQEIGKSVAEDQKLKQTAKTKHAPELDSGETLAADALFFAGKTEPQCNLAATLGCDYQDGKHPETSDKQSAKPHGVFVAGDADGDVQFVVVAAGEGATAAVAMNKELQDEDRGDADETPSKSRMLESFASWIK